MFLITFNNCTGNVSKCVLSLDDMGPFQLLLLFCCQWISQNYWKKTKVLKELSTSLKLKVLIKNRNAER